jgi:hypothetical protein
MYIFEITIPGTRLEAQDRNWTWKIQQLLSHLESQFCEANLAFNLFISSVEKRRTSHSRAQWEADANRRCEIRQQLEEKYNSRFSPELWDQIDFESEVVFKREQWQQVGGAVGVTSSYDINFLARIHMCV